MRIRKPSRPGLLAILAVSVLPACAQSSRPASSPAVIDRVVAVVNNQAILSSDVENELHLAILEPHSPGEPAPTPRAALDDLISRTLIHQQIHQQGVETAQPAEAEVVSRLAELRKNLPACVRMNCSSDAGWTVFLATHHLTQAEVESYLRNRMEILSFIEDRFRQGIHISDDEIASYYRSTLMPQYAKGEPVPPLASVSGRIQEILLQQQVNSLFSAWLDNLRKQGDVEVLDPALETGDPARSGEGQ